MIINIYVFSGCYSGASVYNWDHPEPDVVHKCLLFLRQSADADEYERALSVCRKYGFVDVEFFKRGRIEVEMLNTELFRGFAGLYEEAVAHGSSLLYYPDTAVQ